MTRGDTTTAHSEAASPRGVGTPSPQARGATVTELPHAEAARSAPAAPAKKRSNRPLVLALVGVVALGLAGWKGWSYATVGRFLVSTDDAFVRADVSTIAAKATGHVTRVLVEDNARVAAGDVLAEIDDGDYRLAIAAASDRIATQDATIARIAAQSEAQQATIAQAEAQLASVRSDVERTESDFERAGALVKSNAGTQQRLDQAKADRDRTRAAVAVAEAGVAAAKGALAVFQAQIVEASRVRAELSTALDKAHRDLEFTQVRAPVDGVVGNRAVQVGQYVQPGTRLLALVPLDKVYIEANFKETQLARLKPGQPVEFTVDALGSRVIEGRLVSVAPGSGAQFSLLPPENATGNFTKIVQRVPVKIAVAPEVAREGVLRPGLSVAVDVVTR
ncbi:HlyD family secretion protein [Siculibacillus lacustris]|nr:HlyD family secretion protein [Siculibacillus lacustris]